MVFSVQSTLEFANATRRDNVLVGIQTRIGSKSRFGELIAEAVVAKSGNPAIAVSVSFTSRADMDDLKAWVETNAVGANLPRAGSWIRIHECSHDVSNPQPCVIESQRTW